MRRTFFATCAIAVSIFGADSSNYVPFSGIEEWITVQPIAHSSGARDLLSEKAFLVHGLDRRDFFEGKQSDVLGLPQYAISRELRNSLSLEEGGVIDSVITEDEVHYYSYSTSEAASVKATLAWLEENRSNLDIRIIQPKGFIRPWTQNNDGVMTRASDNDGLSVERVDTEIKKGEEFTVQVSLKKGATKTTPYKLLVSGGHFSTRQKGLRAALEEDRTREESALDRVNRYCEINGVSKDSLREDGTMITMRDVVDGKPLYFKTYNIDAMHSSSIQKLWPTGGIGLDLTGKNLPRSIGIWDGGSVLSYHQEFGDRVTVKDNSAAGDHGTHVGGTMIASGVKGSAKGAAYEATMHSYDWNYDNSEMRSEAANGLAISQHSYGAVDNYEYSKELDELANDHPYYTISKSAGNDGSKGYQTVGLNANAKNIVTVGSAEDQPNGYQGPSVSASSFSSRGPTPDYRIKPDILANGEQVYSASSYGAAEYDFKSGTSMSGPAAAGAMALLHEHYYMTHGNTIMRSATMRGLVIHTADEMGEEGPSYVSGWGYLNAERAASLITQNDSGNGKLIQEIDLNNGERFELGTTPINGEDVIVTVCWNDPAPSTSAGTSRKLINDLDLRVVVDGQEHKPWAMDISSYTAIRADNDRDNVEKVTIPNVSGKRVDIVVTHKGTLTNTQNFSLLLSGVEVYTEPFIRVDYPNGNEEIEQNAVETIRWSSNVDEPVDIILFKGPTAIDTLAKTTPNDGSFEWEIPEDMKTGGNYAIAVQTVSNSYSDESDENFAIIDEFIIAEFPWIEDFESYVTEQFEVGKWNQDQSDDLDWLVFSGVTPTGQFAVDRGEDPGTGPLGDHTSGTGNYIYMEATENYQTNKSCVITSPKFNLENVVAPQLSYWLQMNSQDGKMGTIDVDISVDGVWKKQVKSYSGDKGLEWFSDTVDMSDYVGKRVQVRFYSTVGDSFYSDICLDDIAIEGSPTPSIVSSEIITAKAGVLFEDTVAILNGIDGMALSMIDGPDWLSVDLIDNESFTVWGTPAAEFQGETVVKLQLKVAAQSIIDSLKIDVKANSTPVITPVDDIYLIPEDEFTLDITIEDDDSENLLSLWIENLPEWLSFDVSSEGVGVLEGVPSKEDAGIYDLVIKGNDGVIQTDVEEAFSIIVEDEVSLINDTKTVVTDGILVLPSIISKKADNCQIYLRDSNAKEFELKIFDALGNTLYQHSGALIQHDSGKGYFCTTWDGRTSNGTVATSGSYVLFIKTKENNGQSSIYKTAIGIKK